MQVISRAEAARGDPLAMEPPAQGWEPVTLLDDWTPRWPAHDGVVWYRLSWQQASVDQPVGVLIDHLSMAGMILVNGSTTYRDASLAEPLTRSWATSKYFVIDAPLLRQGENVMLVRTSGLAAYHPGFGTVTVGESGAVEAQYRRNQLLRYDFPLFDQAVSAVLGVMFALVWLLRRRDSSYGWFALTTLLSMVYALNNTVSTPWPFGNTNAWQAFVAAMFLASATSEAVFLLRYADRRWPRVETALLILTVACMGLALMWPDLVGPRRDLLMLSGGVIYYAAIGGFLSVAWRTTRTDYRVLGACLLLPVVASLRDFALLFGWIEGDVYYLSLTSSLTLIGMGFALAWRYSSAVKRIEGFNLELTREVDAATARLSDTLAREHDLALSNMRIGERLHLVRDLHDGFGSSLVGVIAVLEQPRRRPDPAQIIVILKELRDDLRLVIDTTVHDDVEFPLLLATLRHRWSQRFEASDIACSWRIEGLDGVQLSPVRSLDLLRLLQEALTNALKHSQAKCIRVVIRLRDDQLHLSIHDDGHWAAWGNAASCPAGAGLDSMRNRAARLGGQLTLKTGQGEGTLLQLVTPLAQ